MAIFTPGNRTTTNFVQYERNQSYLRIIERPGWTVRIQMKVCAPKTPQAYHTTHYNSREAALAPAKLPSLRTAQIKANMSERLPLAATSVSTALNTAATSETPIHANFIGCLFHVLHLANMKALESPYCLDPLGTGTWHEWKHSHLVALLGTGGYITNKPNASSYSFEQFRKLVRNSKFQARLLLYSSH